MTQSRAAFCQRSENSCLHVHGHIISATLNSGVELGPFIQRHLVPSLKPLEEHHRGEHEPVQSVGAQKTPLQLQACKLAMGTRTLQLLASNADAPSALRSANSSSVLSPPEMSDPTCQAVYLQPVGGHRHLMKGSLKRRHHSRAKQRQGVEEFQSQSLRNWIVLPEELPKPRRISAYPDKEIVDLHRVVSDDADGH
eukprot:CAMPEP_0172783348 /NCGR_PEP_ID=MMETSP1074-20121228/204388_1 /TAXON_ID=2916 /ORGANISM="Ceratium fusus, Strain PA161109" /LENGTH=195 /DNA_ID=CAMNT_0013620337 /DNA_START=844 /DNA_END=1431 /DNA_ORIENTATION=-